MILLIDNYDSFVYNLYQLIGSITPDLKVIRNDACTVEEIEAMHPESIVISPGPGRPEDAGNILEVIRHFTGKTPILGVCLGHQAICKALGGRLRRIRRSDLLRRETDARKNIRNIHRSRQHPVLRFGIPGPGGPVSFSGCLGRGTARHAPHYSPYDGRGNNGRGTQGVPGLRSSVPSGIDYDTPGKTHDSKFSEQLLTYWVVELSGC